MRSHAIRCVVSLAVAGVFAAGAPASAHHSFASMYAVDRTATLEGVVVQVLFRDPHSFVQLAVRQSNGELVKYEVEWRGAAQLMRQGVSRITLQVGDYLIVSGSPSRNPQDHWLRMVSLRRPKDGFTWHQ